MGKEPTLKDEETPLPPAAADPAASPAQPSYAPKPKRWRELVTGVPGWVKGVAGLIIAVGGALAVIYSFMPADLELSLSCRPEIVKLNVTNSGGQTATLGDPTFEMVSTARFGDTNRRTMDADALDNPVRAKPSIPRGESQVYDWLNVYQPHEAEEGETCHMYISVPLVNEQDKVFSADCVCGAE